MATGRLAIFLVSSTTLITTIIVTGTRDISQKSGCPPGTLTPDMPVIAGIPGIPN